MASPDRCNSLVWPLLNSCLKAGGAFMKLWGEKSHTLFYQTTSQFSLKKEGAFPSAPGPTGSPDDGRSETASCLRVGAKLVTEWRGCGAVQVDTWRRFLFITLVLCALSTDAEELYIQQAVVLIEDAMQVSAVTSLSSLNDGGGGEYPIESFTLVFG